MAAPDGAEALEEPTGTGQISELPREGRALGREPNCDWPSRPARARPANGEGPYMLSAPSLRQVRVWPVPAVVSVCPGVLW